MKRYIRSVQAAQVWNVCREAVAAADLQPPTRHDYHLLVCARRMANVHDEVDRQLVFAADDD